MKQIDELREIIRRVHGAESTHIESVPVKEVFRGETVWEGVVEVFELHNHAAATRAYAWSHQTDEPTVRHHFAVLHLGPVTSAVEAVRAAIIGEFKRRAEEA